MFPRALALTLVGVLVVVACDGGSSAPPEQRETTTQPTSSIDPPRADGRRGLAASGGRLQLSRGPGAHGREPARPARLRCARSPTPRPPAATTRPRRGSDRSTAPGGCMLVRPPGGRPAWLLANRLRHRRLARGRGAAHLADRRPRPPHLPEHRHRDGARRSAASRHATSTRPVPTSGSSTSPDEWSGRRTVVRFDGVTSAWFLWVNGRYVGYDQGGYLPAEFDITDHLVRGTTASPSRSTGGAQAPTSRTTTSGDTPGSSGP